MTCYERLRNNIEAGEYLSKIDEYFKNKQQKKDNVGEK